MRPKFPLKNLPQVIPLHAFVPALNKRISELVMLDPRLDHLVDYIETTMEPNEQKFEEMILAINAFIDNIFVERATGQKLMIYVCPTIWRPI